MSTEILINVRSNLTRVAYVEDAILTDLKIEVKTHPTLVGSIFRGKVMRVLPGMQAAFVDIGLDRAAFLYVGDVRADLSRGGGPIFFDEEEPMDQDMLSESEGSSDENKYQIQDLLHEGQILMVQVAKDPLGTKGARITTHVSLPGRNVVFMPTVKHFGISRRISNETERNRLKELVEEMVTEGGVIVRTAGEGAAREALRSDLDYLYRLWKEIQRNYDKRKTPGLVHSEVDVELRSLRDLLTDKVDRVIVDDAMAFKKVSGFVAQFLPKFRNNVVLYDQPKPLFDLYNIELEISRSLDRKIWLKSGGYIVMDEAEALVVIDVNTGRFVGKRDLEDTIIKTNLEAVKEVAHQLRLRNCGGIIIIDFIDMERQHHRDQVMEQLQRELNKDSAKTTINKMSELGLVEMTRKRIRPSLVSILCEPCPYCDGKGYVKRKMTVASEIFRDLERESSRLGDQLYTEVHCHAEVANWIYAEESETLENLEEKLGRSVSFKVNPSFHIEQFEIFTLPKR